MSEYVIYMKLLCVGVDATTIMPHFILLDTFFTSVPVRSKQLSDWHIIRVVGCLI